MSGRFGKSDKLAFAQAVQHKVSNRRHTTRNVETYVDPAVETGVPEAAGDIPIPLLIGRRMFTNFNTIWTGVPITTKETVRSEPNFVQQTASFWGSISTPVNGHNTFLRGEELQQYYEENPDLVSEQTTIKTTVDFAAGLCLGPNVRLMKIEDDIGNEVWSADYWNDGEPVGGGSVHRIEMPDYCEYIDFYSGSFNLAQQPVNAVMSAKDGAALTPAYLGLSYVFIRNVPIADESSPLMAMGIELVASVNPLGLTADVAENDEYDQNIANAIHTIMVDTWRGLGVPAQYVDVPTFTACAVKLASEGNWASVLVSRQTQARNVVAGLLEQADACMRWNPRTAKYEMKLYREDYIPAELPQFNEHNAAGLSGLSRAQWQDVPKSVVIKYVDRHQRYIENSAGIKVNEHVNDFTAQQYTGTFDTVVTTDVAAVVLNLLVARNITPLLSGTISTGRDAEALLPGDACALTWPNIKGVEQFPMRVIDKREVSGGGYSLTLEQAMLPANRLRRPIAPGLATNTTQPVTPPLEGEVSIYDAPLFFAKQRGARFITGNEKSSRIQAPIFLIRGNNGPAFDVRTYDELEHVMALQMSKVIVGTLNTPIAANDGYTDGLIDISFASSDWERVPRNVNRKQGSGYVLIGNEIMQYTMALAYSAGNTELFEVARGLVDTVAQNHAVGTTIYILPDFSMVSKVARGDSSDYFIDIVGRAGSRASIERLSYDVEGRDAVRAALPACPQNGQISAAANNTHPRPESPVIPKGVPHWVTWEERNRFSRTINMRGDGTQIPSEQTIYNLRLRSQSNLDLLADNVQGNAAQVEIPLSVNPGPATIEIQASNANGLSLYREIINLTIA